MIAIDTNVLVRLLTRDHEEQFHQAETLFAQNDIFIPVTVILETEWVLRYSYRFNSAAILDAFSKTFGLPQVHIHHAESVAHAIELARQGSDFSDALHLALSRDCEQLATFDAAFIKKTEGLGRCRVGRPGARN